MSYTVESIRAEIAASNELKQLIPNVTAIAKKLSEGRVKPVKKFVGAGTVMEALGPDVGAAILDGLVAKAATNSPIKWALKLLDRGELDLGSSATRASITALKDAGDLPANVAAALLAVAEIPDPVDEQTVKQAVFNDNGTLAL
jgi:hypothetical protein